MEYVHINLEQMVLFEARHKSDVKWELTSTTTIYKQFLATKPHAEHKDVFPVHLTISPF